MFKFLSGVCLLVCAVLILFTPHQSFAQTNSFVGTVVDTNGQPLADVAFYSEQTGELYMSDASGAFTIEAFEYPINLTPLTQEYAFSPAMLPVVDADTDVSFTGTLLSPDTFDCQFVVTVRQADCEALVAIYETMDGESWKYNDRWMRHRNVCRWWGVACASETGEVTMLHLSFNNLSGEFPDEVSNLTGLRGLHLAHNNVTSLPGSLGSLTNLVQLDVRDNKQLRLLPSSVWSLPNLASLHINGNTELLSVVEPNYTSLEYVDHTHTQLCAWADAALLDWFKSVVLVPNGVNACSSIPLSVMLTNAVVRQQSNPIFWFVGYITLMIVLSLVWLKFGRET